MNKKLKKLRKDSGQMWFKYKFGYENSWRWEYFGKISRDKAEIKALDRVHELRKDANDYDTRDVGWGVQYEIHKKAPNKKVVERTIRKAKAEAKLVLNVIKQLELELVRL